MAGLRHAGAVLIIDSFGAAFTRNKGEEIVIELYALLRALGCRGGVHHRLAGQSHSAELREQTPTQRV